MAMPWIIMFPMAGPFHRTRNHLPAAYGGHTLTQVVRLASSSHQVQHLNGSTGKFFQLFDMVPEGKTEAVIGTAIVIAEALGTALSCLLKIGIKSLLHAVRIVKQGIVGIYYLQNIPSSLTISSIWAKDISDDRCFFKSLQ